MKPFQFYMVRQFPSLQPGQSTSTQYQMTFSGEGEDVQTTVTMENSSFEGELDLLRIQSQIKHHTYGYIKRLIDSKRQTLEFNEYLEPVDFPAYYCAKRKIVVFQTPKRACRGVLRNLLQRDCGITLVEMIVDFAKVLELVTEYQGAWFRGVSSRVRTAGVHGDDIQHDALFKKLLKDGELSNVTIPWQLEDVEHRVMITSTGAIVLVQDYKTNVGLELQIVCDVFDRLLKQVWTERRARARDVGIPEEP